MCLFCFRVSSFSDSFQVRRSVRSLLSSRYGPESISPDILAWYVSVSRVMLVQPLSAGRTMMDLSSFWLLRASCFSFVMLGFSGSAC